MVDDRIGLADRAAAFGHVSGRGAVGGIVQMLDKDILCQHQYVSGSMKWDKEDLPRRFDFQLHPQMQVFSCVG